jgi:ABC-2 type transport system ATP-binding protein
VLALTDLAKRFGDVVALDGVSLALGRGEVFGLLGPNGAGKSTLVSIVAGLSRPDRGEVSIAGQPPASSRVRTRIGIAPQALAIYDPLSAAENLAFFAGLYGLSGRRRRDRVDTALAFAGLSDRRDDRVATFSGGMKRRLNLAVAIVHEPDLLILDEPTVGVDPQSRNAIFEGIRALRGRGVCILYTTHYMDEAERLCDRVGIIDHGRILAVDRVDDLLAAHGGQEILHVTIDGDERVVPTSAPLATLTELARGHAVGRFRVERPTLEQVFLTLTGRSLRD